MARKSTKQRRREAALELISPFLEEWKARTSNAHAAFRNWATEQLLWERGLSTEDIEDVTRIDGPRDKGIDGWYLNTDEAEPVLILIQSKDTQAEIDDLLKLRHGLQALLDRKQRTSANDEAQTRVADLERRLPAGLRVQFHIVTSDIAPPSFADDLRTVSENNPTIRILGEDCPCEYDIHDVERLANEIRVVDERPIEASFTLGAHDFFTHWTGNFKTVTATVPANQLVDLFEEHRTNLFRYNPRYYLSPQTSPNREMRATLLSQDRENFFVYNNGVTAISQSLPDPERPRSSKDEVVLRAANFQIVNGCQTTVTLHSVGKRVPLDKVQVLVRIIEAQNYEGMASQIARTSNNQNRMRESDLKSTDQLQKRIHGEMERESPPWFYEYKRGVWATEYKTKDRREPYLASNGKVRKVTKEDAAQASLSFLGKPAEAAESAGAIFSVADRYSAVFPDDVRAKQLLLSYRLYELSSDYTAAQKSRHVWADYLRYPLVAVTSRFAHEISGYERDEDGYFTYFSADETQQLLATLEIWVEELMKPAFQSLAAEVERRLKDEEIGPRSLVRQREWWEPPYETFKQRMLDRIESERETAEKARQQGVDMKIGFVEAFPLQMVSLE